MAKIIFFGDSTIAPHEKTVTAFELFRQNFPQHTVLNYAEEAGTTQTARTRFFSDILAEKPDVVILSFGINDAWIDVDRKKTEPRVPLTGYTENLRFFFSG